jgi:hypothetical protein
MTSRTAWTAGNLFSSFGWNAAFNGSDLNSMPNGDAVLSSIAAFDNSGGTTVPDQFLDYSFKFSIASSTIVAGAGIAVWLFYLQQDGTIYGDGSLTAGSQAAVTPGLFGVQSSPLRAAASQTTLVGENASPILLKPAKFILAVQNNCGFTLSSSGNSFSIRTYNQQLNN